MFPLNAGVSVSHRDQNVTHVNQCGAGVLIHWQSGKDVLKGVVSIGSPNTFLYAAPPAEH